MSLKLIKFRDFILLTSLFIVVIFVLLIAVDRIFFAFFTSYDNNQKNLAKILSIAENNSGHEFTNDIYDCTQFSQDLVNKLKVENIESYCVSGFWDVYSHTWVEIRIDGKFRGLEATTGKLINEDEYWKHYFIIFKGFCL